MNENNNKLKREIRLWGLSFNIVNIVIGAGIFVLPAIVAAGLGSASILAYLFCGLLITLVMLCFAELGSKITDSGGAYAYIEKTFGELPGFITAILFVIASVTADAAVANAIADIIISIFPALNIKVLRIMFFLILFSGLGYINIIGLKKGIGFVKMMTILKIAPLLLIIFIGFKDVSLSNLYWEGVPSLKAIGETSLILFFAFQGAEVGLSVSGEVKNAKKTIPQAIRLSVLIVLVIYILIQLVSQGILGDSLATFLENPLSEVANHIFGPIGFMLITIGAAVSMFGNLSSEILSMPRVIFAASEDKVLPWKSLSAIHPKHTTPYIAIIVYTAIGFLLASFGGFKQMAIISSSSALLIYLAVSIAVIYLRRKDKNETDPSLFRIPGGITIPVLSALVIILLLSNLTKNELWGIGIFIVFLIGLYFLINSKKYKGRLHKNLEKKKV